MPDPFSFEFKKPDPHRGFPAAAWELAQTQASPLVQLGQELLQWLASIWYEACEQALLRGHFDMVEQAVRKIAEETRSGGFRQADFLELLRLLRSTAVKMKWEPDQLDEIDSVIDVLLPHLENVPEDWRVPVGFSYLHGTVQEAPLGPPAEPAPAAEARGEKRERRRTKLELIARVSPTEVGWGDPEITRTANIARTGIYIYSTRPYTPGQRLFVACPYSDAPGALNRDYLSQVVRIDITPGQPRKGVAIKFLQTI